MREDGSIADALPISEIKAKTKLQVFYDKVEDYKTAVEQRAQKNYSAAFPSGGNGGGDSRGETEMTTSCDCKIQKEKEFKELVHKKCLPYIIFKSVLQHEKRHVLQCETQKALVFCGGSPHIYGANEVDAHIVGIEQYHYWLKENCPNYDVETIKKRIKALQKK